MADCLDHGDANAWEHLIRLCQPIVARAAYRVGSQWGSSSLQEIDDIVQDTFLKLGSARHDALLRARLDSDSSVARYLSVMTANTARDYFRSRYAEKRGEAHRVSDDSVVLGIVPSAAPTSDHQVLLSQIDRSLGGDQREKNVFWLYYRQGFTAREIARIPGFGLSVKGVESMIYRLTATVRRAFSMPAAKGKSGAGAS